MKYNEITWGKMEAIINKIGGEEGVDRLLAGELKVVPVSKGSRPVRKQRVLVRDGSFSAVTLSTQFDPGKFYQTKEGLYVWDDFKTRIVSAAEPVKEGAGFKKTTFWKLTQVATGQDLFAERPKDVWSATDFCAWLSVKLTQQSNGQAGELLNTGYVNLFLVQGINGSVFVVYVLWDSFSRKWGVNTWGLGRDWNAVRRFVSKPIAL